MHRLIQLTGIMILMALSFQLLSPTASYAQSSSNSEVVTWNCTGSPCLWGNELSGQALVWPAALGPVNNRLGYTTSAGVYLPASAASGRTITIVSGSASIYAGTPDAASHRLLASLGSSESYQVTGLYADEVISVQSGGSFAVTWSEPASDAPTPIPVTTTPTATPTEPPATTSQGVTWDCTGSPCPWGGQVSGQALAWPAALGPVNNRLGYTTSAGIYLPASAASGRTITIVSGSASIYAGTPDAGSHRLLASLGSSESYQVTGLYADEVISVQSGGSFAVTWSEPASDAPTPIPVTATPTEPTATPTEPTATPTESPATTSQGVTWDCTGSPCPWGGQVSGQALAWPAALGPVNNRLGYTTSAGIYLPASAASGRTITIVSGSASIYAGTPDAASHRLLASLGSSESYQVTGLYADEVISVQSGGSFAVTWSEPASDAPTPIPVTATPTEPTATPTEPTATPTESPATTSQGVTWDCTGSPCPWGGQVSGQALAWPAALGPVNNRLGYTTSAGIYLPASAASGRTITVVWGGASIYAGAPDAGSHRLLASLGSSESYQVTGLYADEVISVQSGGSFAVTWSEPASDAPTPIPVTTTPTATPIEPTATPEACSDPMNCAVVTSIPAFWRCNIPGCTEPDWLGSVISWPEWAAYEDNIRAGSQSRTVYSADGEKLYPYMGSWANGCQVTAVSGIVLIVEWQRGTDVWRETYISAGQTHTITLISPEDGVLIEENDPSPGFSISLANCSPQVIDKTATPTPTPTSSNPTIGETNILGTDDSGNGNILIAQRAVLSQNATLESLSFYVTNADGQLRLGLYADNGGEPGALVAETTAFTPVIGWNTQPVLAPVSLPAGTYWLAYLAQSDDLHFRVGGSGPARYYSYPFGAMPATFSDATESINVHWSLYASLLN